MTEQQAKYQTRQTDEELYDRMAPPFMETIVEKAEKRGFVQGMALVASALELEIPLRIVARYARQRMRGLDIDGAMDACGLGRRNAVRLERRLLDAGFFGGDTGESAVLSHVSRILEGAEIMRELREGGAV